MSNISTWSTTAGSNNATPPDGWPENMSPSAVNDSARENMAAIARWYAALSGSIATTGSSNAYVLTTGSSHASFGAIGLLSFRANHENTGAATLNVDSLGSKALRANGVALSGGAIKSGKVYLATYSSTDDAFDLHSADVGAALAAQIWAASGIGYITPAATATALAWQTLTDAATVAVDWATFATAEVSLTANRTIGNPTNVVAGQTKYVVVKGNNSTPRTLSFGTNYKGALPVLTDITDTRWYLIVLTALTTSHIIVTWGQAS